MCVCARARACVRVWVGGCGIALSGAALLGAVGALRKQSDNKVSDNEVSDSSISDGSVDYSVLKCKYIMPSSIIFSNCARLSMLGSTARQTQLIIPASTTTCASTRARVSARAERGADYLQ